MVDLDGNDYDGFVFMYNTGRSLEMNSTNTSVGGYAASELAPKIETLYTNLADADLKASIKEVTITCNDGYANSNAKHEYVAHMFLASSKEVGFNFSRYQYAAEGSIFDYFSAGTDTVRANFARSNVANISSNWWLRSACSALDETFYFVATNGNYGLNNANTSYVVVAAFVIG